MMLTNAHVRNDCIKNKRFYLFRRITKLDTNSWTFWYECYAKFISKHTHIFSIIVDIIKLKRTTRKPHWVTCTNHHFLYVRHIENNAHWLKLIDQTETESQFFTLRLWETLCQKSVHSIMTYKDRFLKITESIMSMHRQNSEWFCQTLRKEENL